MVIVVPEHNDMSGGIYSFFSIANHMHAMRRIHGYDVLVMTRPNLTNHTYLRLSAFRNAETVYRFDQIQLCDQVEELYLHIPEYATPFFYDLLSPDLIRYLKSRKKLYINIMNQNVELMPEASAFEDLRGLATELTQSVAHHAYFGQEFADHYNLPTLLLPAYTDLSPYPASTFEEKRKLIIYSLDEAPHRKACLEILDREFSDYERVEIRGISFDRYMQLATDCQFSISFGEGFDGYVAQPIQQGGIGLTVYREEFFPSGDYLNCYNIFSSEKEMVAELATRMRRLAADPDLYRSVNKTFKQEHDKLYSLDDYITRIRRLALRDFDLFPVSPLQYAIGDRERLKALWELIEQNLGKASNDQLARLMQALERTPAERHQDIFALLLTRQFSGGFFVDIGVRDGQIMSKTYLLEKEFGWTGILVEPGRVWHPKLEECRSARIDDRFVAASSGEFIEFNGRKKSNTPLVEGLHRHSARIEESYVVPTISLTDLLREVDAPRHIDFLSISIKLGARAVLEGLDFGKYSFGFICIEQHDHVDSEEDVSDILHGFGYKSAYPRSADKSKPPQMQVTGIDLFFLPSNNSHFKD
jgi:hypothetical protein